MRSTEFFTSLDMPEKLESTKHNSNLNYKNAVVKIFSTRVSPNYQTAWSTPHTSESTASGFALKWQDKNVIMTNAHAVYHSRFVEVKLASQHEKYTAKVLAIGNDVDLALLTVEDEKFWQKTTLLELSDQNPTQEMPIKSVGFPNGGNELCITSGVVSRVEMTSYAHSGVTLLAAHFDAKGTNGNSGGPVLFNNKVVGVTHQVENHKVGGGVTQGLTHMVPLVFIKHFLDDIILSPEFEPEIPLVYRGITNLDIATQAMESPHLRKHFGMKEDMSGVLVAANQKDPHVNKYLKAHDVLLKVDGHIVHNNRTIDYPGLSTPVSFWHPIKLHHIDEKMMLTVLRNGVEQTIEMPVTREQKFVSDYNFNNVEADFVYINGIVFQPVTRNYYYSYSEGQRPDIVAAVNERLTSEKQEIIFIKTILSDKITQGYSGFEHYTIAKINGVKPRNLWDARNALMYNTEKDHVIEMEDADVMVLTRLSKQDDEKLADRYGITRLSSKRYGLFHQDNFACHELLHSILTNEDEPPCDPVILERQEAERQAFVPSANKEEEEKRRILEEELCDEDERPRVIVMNYLRR